MKLWKSDMTQRQLIDRMSVMEKEMNRLEKVRDISESIARLPSVCIDDIKTQDEVQKARDSALHQALERVKGDEYSNLVNEIDQIQDKSRRAYLRLYEKVGEEVGNNFIDKLDYLSQKETEADKLINGNYKYSSAQVEIERLKTEKVRIEKMQREKEKEYLRTDVTQDKKAGDTFFKQTTIGDLFTKYGI